MFRDRYITKIFVVFFKWAVTIIAEIASFFIYNIIPKEGIDSIVEPSMHRIIALIFFNLTFLGMSIVIIILWKKMRKEIRTKGISLFLIFPANQILLLSGMFYANIEKLPMEVMLFATVGLLFSILADILMLEAIKEISQKLIYEERLALIENMRQMELEYYNLMQHHFKEIAIIKHDFKDHMQTAYNLINNKSGESQEVAKEMLDTLTDKICDATPHIYCENCVVNTIVTVKIQNAIENGIDTDVNISIPEKINIEKIDLCSAFSNLLDNAIDGCNSIDNHEKLKFIRLKSIIRAGFLVVKIENSKGNNIIKTDGEIKTTKKAKKGHGYGLELLNKIAVKYDGDINFDFSDDKFTTTIMLRANKL